MKQVIAHCSKCDATYTLEVLEEDKVQLKPCPLCGFREIDLEISI